MKTLVGLGLAVLLLSGCGSSATRDDLIRYYTMQLELARSPEFRILMRTDPAAALDQTRRNMAECGFESLEELMAVTARYREDPAVKPLLEKIRALARDWPPPPDHAPPESRGTADGEPGE
jgi:hypothetical protein